MVVWDGLNGTSFEVLRAPESRLRPFTEYVSSFFFKTKGNLHVEVPYTLNGWLTDQR